MRPSTRFSHPIHQNYSTARESHIHSKGQSAKGQRCHLRREFFVKNMSSKPFYPPIFAHSHLTFAGRTYQRHFTQHEGSTFNTDVLVTDISGLGNGTNVGSESVGFQEKEREERKLGRETKEHCGGTGRDVLR